MKTMTKRTAVAALTGVMAVGMLTGCGEKKLDGTKTVATVDGTEIPLGIVSLSVREGQAQTEAMYKSFMGGQDYSIWSMDAEDGKVGGHEPGGGSCPPVPTRHGGAGRSAVCG